MRDGPRDPDVAEEAGRLQVAPLDALPDTQPYDTGDTVQSVFRSGAGCGTGRGGGV